ncbi:hypothetical protein [Dictyobacter kobayashii]|uniref:Uncharacterized protein n=1 Tax=Dictyobacter kobayashii TaxID=2014872 RepID=A0A402AEJ9_9CHLR|nr:hypothetical protein [Dictyobacter kobayashii]GCE17472.1 hypothetical protein KDK_12720 [Dictyobacter kobayashii]
MPSSSLGVSAATRVEDGRVTSRPLPPPEQAFISSKGFTAPQAAVTVPRRKRNRLLLPTIVIAVLLVVAIVGGGAWWYFLRPSSAQTTLDNASTLITQAKSNLSSKPDQALASLTRAQQELHSLNDASLNPQQSNQLTSLQNDLTAEFKTAVANFNQQH